MLLRDPRPTIQNAETTRDIQYEDTENMPVVSNTDNPCPYWHAPQIRASLDLSKIDYEKAAGRALFIGMGVFTLIVSVILLGKVLWMVWVLK